MDIRNELNKINSNVFWTDSLNYYLGKVGFESDTVQEYINITKRLLEEGRIEELRMFLLKYSDFPAIVLQTDNFNVIKTCNSFIQKAIDSCKNAELAQKSE